MGFLSAIRALSMVEPRRCLLDATSITIMCGGRTAYRFGAVVPPPSMGSFAPHLPRKQQILETNPAVKMRCLTAYDEARKKALHYLCIKLHIVQCTPQTLNCHTIQRRMQCAIKLLEICSALKTRWSKTEQRRKERIIFIWAPKQQATSRQTTNTIQDDTAPA